MSGILAGLVAQAEAQGAARVTVQAIIEEAADTGAERALRRIGLMDDHAGHDIKELRQLVQGWRDVKSSAVKSLVSWLVRTMVAALLFGLAFKLGLVRGERP
ncbi:DUF6127 family protein [Sandarakinorhabdus sp.]|uniref:DUF6127 family protein n=1 Tax=Sandarakinorhabdus sp. TaxID=1916663 RepID=UPI00333F0E1F